MDRTDSKNNTPETHAGSRNVREGAGRRSPWGFTYFIRRGDAVKIGHSALPKERVSSLQAGFPDKLDVLAVVPNTVISETTAHQKFSHLRISGEWFKADPELLQFIESIKPETPPKKVVALVPKHLLDSLKVLSERYREADAYNKPAIEFALRKTFKAANSAKEI